MHCQRLLTAAVLGPLLYLALWWGGRKIFGIVLIGASAACLYEYFSISFAGRRAIQGLGVMFGLFPVCSALLCEDPGFMILAVYLAFIGSIFVFIASYASWSDVLKNWSMFFMGTAYLGVCAAHLGLLRSMPMGKEWLLFLLIIVFSGDAGAYYAGKGLGRHKLCPKVSKGKTVEGAVGGLILNAVAAVVLWLALLKDIHLAALIITALVLGAVGQVGDLAESMVKRSSGVKDSGSILPGHGGVLDRIDAVLLAAPVLYWIVSLSVVIN